MPHRSFPYKSHALMPLRHFTEHSGTLSFSTWAFSLYLASFRILIRNSVQKMLDLPFSISKRKHPRLHQFSASVFLSYFSKIESFSFGYPLNLPFQLVEHLHNVMLSFHKCCLLPSTIFWVSVCNWNCFSFHNFFLEFNQTHS